MFRVLIALIVCVCFCCSGKSPTAAGEYILEYTARGDLLGLNEELYFRFINALDTDDDGNLYLSDGNRRVIKCAPDGKILWIRDRMGEAPGEFQRVTDLCCHNDWVYVCDQFKKSILVFDRNGEYHREFKIHIETPLEIEIDSSGLLYLKGFGEAANGRLLHLHDLDGTYRRSIIERFTTDPDHFLQNAKNSFAFTLDRDNQVLLVTWYYYHLYRFDSQGALLADWIRDLPYTPREPKTVRDANSIRIVGDRVVRDIAVDPNGMIYALRDERGTDSGMPVDIFSPDGHWVHTFYTGIRSPEGLQQIHHGPEGIFFVISQIEDPNIFCFSLHLKKK